MDPQFLPWVSYPLLHFLQFGPRNCGKNVLALQPISPNDPCQLFA